MRSVLSVLFVTLLFGVPSTEVAAQPRPVNQNLSYTFLEIDYINLDVDDFDDDEGLIDDWDDGGGFGIRGSFAFTPNFFAFIGYSETDSDATYIDGDQVIYSSSQDLKRFDIGLGMNFGVFLPMVGDSDVVVRAAYSDLDLDDFNFGASDDSDINDLFDDSSDGFFIDAGLRSQLASWVEASLGVRYTDIGAAENFSLIGNVLLEMTQNWGVNLELDVGDDISTYLIGLRYSFDRF